MSTFTFNACGLPRQAVAELPHLRINEWRVGGCVDLSRPGLHNGGMLGFTAGGEDPTLEALDHSVRAAVPFDSSKTIRTAPCSPAYSYQAGAGKRKCEICGAKLSTLEQRRGDCSRHNRPSKHYIVVRDKRPRPSFSSAQRRFAVRVIGD
jgi:hypothetical protein